MTKLDSDDVIERLRGDGDFRQYLVLDGEPEEVCSDREVVLWALAYNGHNLQFASDELRADREIVFQAIRQPGEESFDSLCGEALKYASDDLRADPEVVLEAAQAYGRMIYDGMSDGENPLSSASENLRADPKFILKAQLIIEEYADLDEGGTWGPDLEGALAYASPALRADKDFMLRAIRQSGYGYDLIYASDELKADRDLVLAALSKSPYAFGEESGPPSNFMADREFLVDAVRQNGCALKYASEELRADREVVLEALRQDGVALQYASDDLRANPEVVLQAIEHKFYAIKYASENLSTDGNLAAYIQIKTAKLRQKFKSKISAFDTSLFWFAVISILPIALYFIDWKVLAVVIAPFCFFPLAFSIYRSWYERSYGRSLGHRAAMVLMMFFYVPLSGLFWLVALIIADNRID